MLKINSMSAESRLGIRQRKQQECRGTDVQNIVYIFVRYM